MSLHDYFCGKWSLDEHESQAKDSGIPFNKLRNVFQRSAKKESEAEEDDSGRDDAEPEWALNYLNPTNAQALSEAFDEDASGFITIREVNEFTRLKPYSWSLLHWIAYWVIGWYQSLGHYRNELQNLIAKLLRYLPSLRQENRRAADQYLESMLGYILPLVNSLNAVEEDDILTEKFEDYNNQVERRLKDMLEKVHYTINGKDGVKMVIEDERVETRLFPLLYLLIRRHLDIFRIAMKKVLSPSELEEAKESIEAIAAVVSDRVRKLEVIFTQQKLRVNEHFCGFANGMFEYVNEPSKFWSSETILRIDPSRPYSYLFLWEDEDDSEELDPKNICNHEVSEVPFWTLEKAFKEAYSGNAETSDSESNPEEPDSRDPDDNDAPDEKNPDTTGVGEAREWLSGREWNGFCNSDNSDIRAQLLSFRFDVNDETQADDHCDVKVGGSVLIQSHEYFPRGTCNVMRSIEGIILEPAGDEELQLSGKISSVDRRIMTGKMTIQISPTETTTCTIFLEQRLRDTDFYDQYRPPFSEFDQSKPRALWKFAFTAVMAQVSEGKPFSPASQNERKRIRERFVDLLYERKLGNFDSDESDTYWSIRENLRAEDKEYYEALVNDKLSKQPKHCGYTCDNCHRTIYGARTICITCVENNGPNTVDFCDRNDCITAQGTPRRGDLAIPHSTWHTLLKTRRMVFLTMLGRTIRDAKETQENIKRLLADSQSELASSTRRRPSLSANGTGLTCICCRKRVSPPFWACIGCDDVTCICMECDKAGKAAVAEGYRGEHDFNEHVLLKWQATSFPGFTVEERLARIETSLAKVAEWGASIKEQDRKVDQLIAALTKSGLQGLETSTWSSM